MQDGTAMISLYIFRRSLCLQGYTRVCVCVVRINPGWSPIRDITTPAGAYTQGAYDTECGYRDTLHNIYGIMSFYSSTFLIFSIFYIESQCVLNKISLIAEWAYFNFIHT